MSNCLVLLREQLGGSLLSIYRSHFETRSLLVLWLVRELKENSLTVFFSRGWKFLTFTFIRKTAPDELGLHGVVLDETFEW